jgi:hypothetical protein
MFLFKKLKLITAASLLCGLIVFNSKSAAAQQAALVLSDPQVLVGSNGAEIFVGYSDTLESVSIEYGPTDRLGQKTSSIKMSFDGVKHDIVGFKTKTKYFYKIIGQKTGSPDLSSEMKSFSTSGSSVRISIENRATKKVISSKVTAKCTGATTISDNTGLAIFEDLPSGACSFIVEGSKIVALEQDIAEYNPAISATEVFQKQVSYQIDIARTASSKILSRLVVANIALLAGTLVIFALINRARIFVPATELTVEIAEQQSPIVEHQNIVRPAEPEVVVSSRSRPLREPDQSVLVLPSSPLPSAGLPKTRPRIDPESQQDSSSLTIRH